METHIPKLKDPVFPVASWKAGTMGGKLRDRFETFSCVHASVSQVSEHQPRYELQLR